MSTTRCGHCGRDGVDTGMKCRWCENTGERLYAHAPLETVDSILEVIESYGPYGADIKFDLRAQILLADEVKRLRAAASPLLPQQEGEQTMACHFCDGKGYFETPNRGFDPVKGPYVDIVLCEHCKGTKQLPLSAAVLPQVGEAKPMPEKITRNRHIGGSEAYIATEHYNEGWNDCIDALKSAAPAGLGEVKAVALEELSKMNDALCDFARRWKLNGDWLTCKKCKHNHIASKAEQSFYHSMDCKAAAISETHPWRTLISIVAPLYAAPVVLALPGAALDASMPVAEKDADVYCKACGGYGTISTGIAEWSSTQCDKCNGTGLQGEKP